MLFDKSRIHPVYLGRKHMALASTRAGVTDAVQVNWSDIYTQARIAELRRDSPLPKAAE
jgi:murein L,D-transpeptidase YcbB/YkuD